MSDSAESTVALPPGSTGQAMRLRVGDGRNAIPPGVAEEVVVLSDKVGNLHGDGRMRELPVAAATLDEISAELRRMSLILCAGFNLDPSDFDLDLDLD